MTPAGHLLSGYLVGEWAAGREHPARWRVLAAAVIGSLAPDLDVALGLARGWAGASAHRGATHSFLGAVVFAGLVAVLLGRPRRLLFASALGGVLTHIFWDWLNPWGVRPLWPWPRSFRGNLLHEGDLYALAIVMAASVLAWCSRRRASALALAVLLPLYLLLQLWWRDHARELARAELAGRRAAVYPTNELRCGWIALSAGQTDMRVDCISSPAAARLRTVYQVPIRDDFFIQASAQSPAVREFREKIAFAFAEEKPAEDGGTLVVWRDLRVAHQERSPAPPTGLYVWLDSAGRIQNERHRWWLAWW